MTHRSPLYDNSLPRYLPHMEHPEVLQMGLSPLGHQPWIETDTDLPRYYQHKIEQRQLHGDAVYRAQPSSQAAQRELAQALLQYLCAEQSAVYEKDGDLLHYLPGDLFTPIDAAEPLWNCSLWVADDLVIMEKAQRDYVLSAASLCSPSHWLLREKFGRPLHEIHDAIPGFHAALTPRINRFFEHLRPEHPVVRYNWSLQESNELSQLPQAEAQIEPDTPLFYRTERQSLLRLPQSDAVAFTIRVYLHPLENLQNEAGAMNALFQAIEATPPELADYKNFPAMAAALRKYRPDTH